MREIRHAACLTDGCPELTATRSTRRKLRCNKCRVLQVRAQMAKIRKRRGPLPDISPAEIDAKFQQALAEIRRRPRTTEVSWPSSMAGWTL